MIVKIVWSIFETRTFQCRRINGHNVFYWCVTHSSHPCVLHVGIVASSLSPPDDHLLQFFEASSESSLYVMALFANDSDKIYWEKVDEIRKPTVVYRYFDRMFDCKYVFWHKQIVSIDIIFIYTITVYTQYSSTSYL